jgi:hypothetical protein
VRAGVDLHPTGGRCYRTVVSLLARSQILLRYRFAAHTQASRHFHVREAAGLVFFPALDKRAREGSTAMLELIFDDSEQTRMIMGEVGAVTGAGMWLRSPDLALGKELERMMSPRKHRRLGANLFLELRRGGHRTLVTMRDLSLGGAALGNVNGIAAGERLHARLLSPVTGVPADLYAALDIAWSNAQAAEHNPLCCREACLDPSPAGIQLLAG